MNIKVYFEKTEKTIPFDNQHAMNGFIHRVLGESNKYHDGFSGYCISSVMGGKMSDGKSGLVFDCEPYIIVSSPDSGFVNDFLSGLVNAFSSRSADFYGLYPSRFETYENNVNKTYDVIKTNSPILLKDREGRKITFKDDGWLERLKEQCVKKLEHRNIKDDSFDIVIGNFGTLKTKSIIVNGVFNPCTNAILTVYGRKETRDTLYSLGLGNSTGSGFGSVSVFRK